MRATGQAVAKVREAAQGARRAHPDRVGLAAEGMMRAGERRESGVSRGCRVEVLLAAFAVIGVVRVLDVESDVAVRGARLLGRLNL